MIEYIKKILSHQYKDLEKENKNFEKKDFTLMIQGPFNNTAIEGYKENKDCFINAVYSTWKNKNEVSNELESEITLKTSSLPSVEGKYNGANIYYQVVSTLEGLKEVKTPYVFKHRSDEKYSNLGLVLNQFNPNKLLCSNIFFRPLSYASYHISDHFFVGRTKNLIKAFSDFKSYLDEGNEDRHGILENKYSPEQLLGIFYINSFGEFSIKNLIDNKKDKKFVFKLMNQYFDVFDIEKLKPYIVRHNHLNNVITEFKKIDKRILVKYISKIKDIK